MYVRQRLNEAYENVQFAADRTWTNTPDDYQETNMELYLTERHIEEERLPTYRPRTVAECIPKSRLARYANYAYDESREMSYASSVSSSDATLSPQSPTEYWQKPEVGDLYKWFLKSHLEDYCSRFKKPYESPLLRVSGFEDKILKLKITEDRVKTIWNEERQQSGEEPQSRARQLLVNLFVSPMKNAYLFKNERHSHEWFRNMSVSRDLEQLERLSNSFRDQREMLQGADDPQPTSSEATPTEILYSEVLQGLTPNRRVVSSLKGEHADEQQPSTSQENFSNYTVLNSQRQVEPSTNNSFNPLNPVSNKFVPQENTAPSLFKCQSNFPRTTMLQTFSSSYVQQTYFYTPIQTSHRWTPPNHPSYYPTQIFTQTWYSQKPVVPNVSRIFGAPHRSVPSDNVSGQLFDCVRVEDSQFEPLKEPQIPRSASEELAVQALEQYDDSNENLMQELERQAVEQFANSPD